MSKKAWTLAELTITVMVFIMLCGFGIKIFKPDYSKGKLYAYATIENLSRGNFGVLEKFGNNLGDNVDTGNDPYCMNLADVFSIKSNPDCNVASGDREKKKNIILANGVTLYGVTSAWKEPYTGASFTVKNFFFDIDGDSGLNRLWVDRFPMRVYKGGRYSGGIQLVNCGDDKYYLEDGTAVNNAASPHCGSTASGISETMQDSKFDYLVTYDIYRVAKGDGITKSDLVEAGVPPIEADCKAYGGQGFYSYVKCNKKDKYYLSKYCASDLLCAKCAGGTGAGAYNVCPSGYRSVDSCKNIGQIENPPIDGTQGYCFTVVHRPNVGAGLMFGSVLSTISNM